MSRTKRYLELSAQKKQIEKELSELKLEILEVLGDSSMIMLDQCAVSKRVVNGYETISAENFRAMRANPVMRDLIAPYVTVTASKVSLDIKALA